MRVYVLHSRLQTVPNGSFALSGLSDTTGVNVAELGSKTVPTSEDLRIYIRCLKLNLIQRMIHYNQCFLKKQFKTGIPHTGKIKSMS